MAPHMINVTAADIDA